MHEDLYEKLKIDTYLLHFYFSLTRGYFNPDQWNEINDLSQANIERLELMEGIDWDGRYDLVIEQLTNTQRYLSQSRAYFPYNQTCTDYDIIQYLIDNHSSFYQTGIMIKDFRKLFDISDLLKEGYMMHDVFTGYSAPHRYGFQIDCIDFLRSSAHFYNEGYDHYTDKKQVSLSNQKLPFEDKEIQSATEIAFRSFRESYINLIFFIESFINSVGFDAFLSGVTTDEDKQNKLKGIESVKKNYKKYSTLRKKIENISQIINKAPIDTSLEPYRTYLESSVELRNQYLHSSPEKGKILLTLEDWKEKCDRMVDEECMALLQAFWKECYPNKSFPVVIFNNFGNYFKGHQGKFLTI